MWICIKKTWNLKNPKKQFFLQTELCQRSECNWAQSVKADQPVYFCTLETFKWSGKIYQKRKSRLFMKIITLCIQIRSKKQKVWVVITKDFFELPHSHTLQRKYLHCLQIWGTSKIFFFFYFCSLNFICLVLLPVNS